MLRDGLTHCGLTKYPSAPSPLRGAEERCVPQWDIAGEPNSRVGAQKYSRSSLDHVRCIEYVAHDVFQLIFET